MSERLWSLMPATASSRRRSTCLRSLGRRPWWKPLANCSMPPGQTKNAFYKDALLERWQADNCSFRLWARLLACTRASPVPGKHDSTARNAAQGRFPRAVSKLTAASVLWARPKTCTGRPRVRFVQLGNFRKHGLHVLHCHCSIGSGESCHIAGCGPGTHYDRTRSRRR